MIWLCIRVPGPWGFFDTYFIEDVAHTSVFVVVFVLLSCDHFILSLSYELFFMRGLEEINFF